jgi:hypothetical protein
MRSACTVALSIWPLTGSLSTDWNQRSACAVSDPAVQNPGITKDRGHRVR